MPDTYIISKTTDPSSNGTSEVVLEKNDRGEPSKVISTTQAAELSKAEKDQLAALGVEVEEASADEVAESGGAQQVGSDAAAAGPVIGSGSASPSSSGSESTKK